MYTTIDAEPEPGVALMMTMKPPAQVVLVFTNIMEVVAIREFVRVMVCELPPATRVPPSEVILPVILFNVTAALEMVPAAYSKP